MRLDGAVQQFTTALDSDQTIVLEGHKVYGVARGTGGSQGRKQTSDGLH